LPGWLTRKFEKKLPSSSIKRFAVTEKTVQNPLEELENLLTHPESSEEVVIYQQLVNEEKEKMCRAIAAFEAESENRIGFPVQFSSKGIDFITDRALTEEMDVED
jgi:hypothetical protein